MSAGKGSFVMVEYGSSASDRRPIDELGVFELTSEECADLNRRMVGSPCRMLPADWFPEVHARG